jgi:Uma2 family endonuclease
MARVSRVVKPRVSFGDLQHQPEEGRRYEIFDGEMFVVPSPLPLHQLVTVNIDERLRAYARLHGGRSLVAPVDVVLSDYDVVQPDVVFFSSTRQHLVELREPIRHRPDLVVEVLSKSTAATDRGRKLQTYARFNVPEYWIVDPDAPSIEILQLQGGAYALAARAAGSETVASATLPDLAISPRDVVPEA